MTRRGAYAKGIAKREEILQVALDVIARHGYRGASVREIADAADLSQAGLLHYFGSKDELLTAVLRRRDELTPTGPSDAPATEVLDGFVRTIARNSEVPGLVHLYAQLSIEAADPAHVAHRYFAERFVDLRRYLAETLRRGQSDGSLRAGFDAERMAAVIISTADGLQTQWLLDPTVDMGAAIGALVDSLR